MADGALTFTITLPRSSPRLAAATSKPKGIALPLGTNPLTDALVTAEAAADAAAAATTAATAPPPTPAPPLPPDEPEPPRVAPPKGKLELGTVLELDGLDELGIVGIFGKNGILL